MLISHRGNIFGPIPENENKPDYLIDAINKGFDIETDFWFIDNDFYLGHDKPQYKVNYLFIYNIKKYLWAHAKNQEALLRLLNGNINCFWHEEDERTLTSKGYIWTYPGRIIADRKSIAVMPESVNSWDISKAEGICSNYVGSYRNNEGTISK